MSEIEAVKLSDADMARMFVGKHRKEIRWCPEWEKWLIWKGTHWDQDKGGMQVQEWGKAFIGSATGIRNMLQLAKSLVVVHPHELDAHPYILNTPVGIINLKMDSILDEYGQPVHHDEMYLSAHDSDKLCTKMTGVKWAPTQNMVWEPGANDWVQAPPSRWETFLEEVQPDPDVRDYLQRWAGYMLCGEIREHEMLVLEGEGANGKSVFMKVLLGVMGEYAGAGSHSLLIEQRNDDHPTVLADTKGLRMCVVSETPRNARLNEARLSQLTAGDSLKARRMREDLWSFTPTAKLVMVTNHKPELTSGEAIWRRVKTVTWPVTIPVENRDYDLDRKILAHEGEKVLDWMFDGWFMYQREGLAMPDSLLDANEKYRAEQDVIGLYIDEVPFTVGDTNDLKVSSSDFNYGLDEWCRHSGMIRPTRNERTKIMEKKGFIRRRTATGWFWHGLARPENALTQMRRNP